MLKPVTICSGGDGGRNNDGRLGCISFQACDLFLQRCDLVTEFTFTVLKHHQFHVRPFVQDETNLRQAFIHLLLLQLNFEQRDFRVELNVGTSCLLQLAPDAANFSVCFLLPFLPLNSSLLSLSKGLSNGDQCPFEASEFAFLVLEATLDIVIFSFQRSCAIVIIPQMPQFLVVSLVDLACEKLYLFSGAVQLFPVILVREEAVALLSYCSRGLLSSSLVTNSNSNLEF